MCRQLEWLRYRDLTEFGTEQEFVAALLAASECTRMDGRPKILSSQNSIPFHPALAAYRAAYCDDRSLVMELLLVMSILILPPIFSNHIRSAKQSPLVCKEMRLFELLPWARPYLTVMDFESSFNLLSLFKPAPTRLLACCCAFWVWMDSE